MAYCKIELPLNILHFRSLSVQIRKISPSSFEILDVNSSLSVLN